MRLGNSQRNDFWDHIFACNLSAIQLKFTIYVYNTTFECNKNSVYVRNLSGMAKTYGYDRSNFFREIQELVDSGIMDVDKKRYKLNLDYNIWVMCRKKFKKIQKFNGASIHQQLQKKTV